MHRIDGPTATPGNLYTDGDPVAGVPATIATDDWLNAVQEEICNVITSTGTALSKANNTQLLAAFQTLLAAARTPPGAVQGFISETAPTGWLKCNGATANRTADAALFAVIGTRFGAGDGSTTFTLPDLRGEFLRGWSDGHTVDAGRALGSAQADAFKSHGHLFLGDDQAGIKGYTLVANLSTGFNQDNVNGGDYRTKADPATPGDTETRPRNVAILMCIKR